MFLSQSPHAHSKVDLKKHFVCEPCPPRINGFLDAPRNQIVLCQNAVYSAENAGQTLTHELIHLYDHCRGNVNWDDPRQQACSEVVTSSACVSSIASY